MTDQNPRRLDGSVIIVTGASRGIGRDIALKSGRPPRGGWGWRRRTPC